MRPPLVFILTAVFALLQVAFLDYFKFFGVKPDLLLAAAFIGGIFLGLKPALALSIFAGILKDAFSLNAFGLSAVLFPLWVLLIAKLIRRISIEDNLSRTLLILTVALLNNLISGFVLIYTGAFVPLGIFLRIVVLSSIYTALSFYLTMRFMDKCPGLK
jgi:rod shape-determining protein MreD